MEFIENIKTKLRMKRLENLLTKADIYVELEDKKKISYVQLSNDVRALLGNIQFGKRLEQDKAIKRIQKEYPDISEYALCFYGNSSSYGKNYIRSEIVSWRYSFKEKDPFENPEDRMVLEEEL